MATRPLSILCSLSPPPAWKKCELLGLKVCLLFPTLLRNLSKKVNIKGIKNLEYKTAIKYKIYQ